MKKESKQESKENLEKLESKNTQNTMDALFSGAIKFKEENINDKIKASLS